MAQPRGSPRPRPVFRECFEIDVAKVGEIALHQHYDYELIRSVRGRYECELNGRRLALRSGEALLIKPGDLHLDRFKSAPIRYQMLSFYVEAEDARQPLALFAPGVTPERQRLPLSKQELAEMFARLLREVRGADEFSPSIRQALVEELFWRIVRSLPPESRQPGLVQDEPEAARFRAGLHRVFAESVRAGLLGVDAMAERLHVSRRSLARKCRQWLGVSPARAFLNYRMETAASLLRQTAMTGKEISAYLGFANPYHFSAAFKRVFRLSPHAYRAGRDPHGPRSQDVA